MQRTACNSLCVVVCPVWIFQYAWCQCCVVVWQFFCCELWHHRVGLYKLALLWKYCLCCIEFTLWFIFFTIQRYRPGVREKKNSINPWGLWSHWEMAHMPDHQSQASKRYANHTFPKCSAETIVWKWWIWKEVAEICQKVIISGKTSGTENCREMKIHTMRSKQHQNYDHNSFGFNMVAWVQHGCTVLCHNVMKVQECARHLILAKTSQLDYSEIH